MLSLYVPQDNLDFSMPVICSLSIESAGQTRYAQSGSTPASLAWPLANQAIYVPFQVPETITFARAHWYNGATVAGNVDVGIYSDAGTRLASTGAVAQATINVVQSAALTASATLTPGRYYMAMSCSLGTATVFAQAASLLPKLAGFLQQASAHPLPATATFSTWTSTINPVFSISALGA